ncbi:hypothetical protein KR009_003350 [Drosophila setifemur]|nr:hypothetical protein KR009_003350 [Drosophila setifemur]
MDEETDMLQLDNVECEVCNGKSFQEREGFYYCIECGTQKQHVQAVDLAAEDNFNETAARRTIRQPKGEEIKADASEITSWEFYNYVLRGFVQELLNMGAKPELKLMTLQVWAAYMSRMEVAFCKNELGLPKLNVRALHRDARIIYNRKRVKRKQVRRATLAFEPTDQTARKRLWNKTKRQLDASRYTQPAESVTEQSMGVQWSWRARKTLKTHMPLKHLDKHSRDSNSSMQCHGLRPPAMQLNNFDRHIYSLTTIKLFIVLGIALNMVEDDIQLADLMRYIDEEHLTSRNMLTYLPDTSGAKGKALIKELEFGNNKDKCTYKYMRMHIGYMARFINVFNFQTPNLLSLAERYILDLALPPRLVKYVGSLMNLYPPKFTPSTPYVYPRYEARVMAYILYAMKLLFGLDDRKELKISESAATINKETSSSLFVFSEWMQFVELRKVMVSHYNHSFGRRYGVSNLLGVQVDDILAKEAKEKEYNDEEVQIAPTIKRQYENMKHMIEKLLKEHFGESIEESLAKNHIEFQPSLTPAHSYFKRILLQASRSEGAEMAYSIPDTMQVDHTQRDLDPFVLETDQLSQLVARQGYKLRVEELTCPKDNKPVGLFYPLERIRCRKREFRANCDINTETWMKEIKKKEKRPDFRFRLANATYGAPYLARKQKKLSMRQNLEAKNPFWQINETPSYVIKVNEEEILLNNLSSLQTFAEGNMDPLRVPLDQPRRHLEESSISSEEEPIRCKRDSESDKTNVKQEELLLQVSSFDCWLLHGYMASMRETDKLQLRQLFPHSFRWLLEYCSSTIGVPWDILYDQLLVVEVMFHHSIQDWSNHKKLLRIQYDNTNKDIATLSRTFKDLW